jgi:hypothetical protein
MFLYPWAVTLVRSLLTDDTKILQTVFMLINDLALHIFSQGHICKVNMCLKPESLKTCTRMQTDWRVALHPSSKGMSVCGLSLACLTSIVLCHTHSCSLCYPTWSGESNPSVSSFLLLMRPRHAWPLHTVISLLASRIPCFQGADSQFNPPVLFARLNDVLKPCVCACTHAAIRVVRRAWHIGIAPVHVWHGTVAPGSQ